MVSAGIFQLSLISILSKPFNLNFTFQRIYCGNPKSQVHIHENENVSSALLDLLIHGSE